jgi:hypothetical protein
MGVLSASDSGPLRLPSFLYSTSPGVLHALSASTIVQSELSEYSASVGQLQAHAAPQNARSGNREWVQVRYGLAESTSGLKFNDDQSIHRFRSVTFRILSKHERKALRKPFIKFKFLVSIVGQRCSIVA